MESISMSAMFSEKKLKAYNWKKGWKKMFQFSWIIPHLGLQSSSKTAKVVSATEREVIETAQNPGKDPEEKLQMSWLSAQRDLKGN